MILIEESFLELFLPEGTTKWFDIIEGRKDKENIYITLEEKNNPPVLEKEKEKIKSKGFHEITITDFPIRGKRTLLTFRRRYWKLEGKKELVKRDIKLIFPGTQLEKEFADFLKEKSRDIPDFSRIYSGFVQPPDKRI